MGKRTHGKRSREKGKNWEREVAKQLRSIFGDAVHRGHQNTHGGYSVGEGCDVDGTPYYIETKHRKRVNPRDAIDQARECQEKTQEDKRFRVAICKVDHKKPTATMELDQWIELTSEWSKARLDTGDEINSITEQIPLVTVSLELWLAIIEDIEERKR